MNKPFDLQRAIAGDPIITRDGRKAKFVAYVPECREEYRVIAFIDGDHDCASFCESGSYASDEENSIDLFMAPKKRTVYVNFYSYGVAQHFHDSVIAKTRAAGSAIAVAIPVEIEE